MKILSFQHGENIRLGAWHGDWIVDLQRAYRHSLAEQYPLKAAEIAACWLPGDMTQFLRGGEDAMRAAREALAFVRDQLKTEEGMARIRARGVLRQLEQVRLLPTVPQPGKIFCIGKNYADHAAELGGEVPSSPEIFVRFASTLIPNGAPIIKPRETDMWDYEAELAVIIGKGGRRIRRENALSHVAGYSCFNDVSARDFQKRITQWTAGKNFDSSGPFGPYLVTADEVGDPQALDIQMIVSGEVLQHANTRLMIYPIDFLIAHLSEFITLQPGDVIMTGTPGGVGMGRKPQRWLRAGDVVQVVIEKVGELKNAVVNEQ